MPVKKSNIELHDNTVKKYFYHERFGDDVKVELEKALAMEKLCIENGIVIAKYLDIDYENHSITYERLVGYTKLKDQYIEVLNERTSIEEGVELQFLSGKTLGIIHKNLHLPSQNKWQPNKSITQAIVKIENNEFSSLFNNTPKAFLHCDYGFANVAYQKEISGGYKIVLFDPSPNRYVTTKANEYGTIYVDIGIYFSGLNGRISLKNYKSANWKTLPLLKNAFCEGYTSVTNIEIDQYKAELMAYGALSALYGTSSISRRIKLKTIYNSMKGNIFWKK